MWTFSSLFSLSLYLFPKKKIFVWNVLLCKQKKTITKKNKLQITKQTKQHVQKTKQNSPGISLYVCVCVCVSKNRERDNCKWKNEKLSFAVVTVCKCNILDFSFYFWKWKNQKIFWPVPSSISKQTFSHLIKLLASIYLSLSLSLSLSLYFFLSLSLILFIWRQTFLDMFICYNCSERKSEPIFTQILLENQKQNEFFLFFFSKKMQNKIIGKANLKL